MSMDKEMVYVQDRINDLEFQKLNIEIEIEKLQNILGRLE